MAKKFNRGFTLIELVIVIAVIAILAGVSTVLVSHILGDARIARATSEVKVLGEAILNLYRDTTFWPQDNTINTEALWNNPRNGLFRTSAGQVHARYPTRAWKGPYLNKQVGLDPWGRAYHYRSRTSGNVTIRGVACGSQDRTVNTTFLQLQPQGDDIVFFIQ